MSEELKKMIPLIDLIRHLNWRRSVLKEGNFQTEFERGIVYEVDILESFINGYKEDLNNPQMAILENEIVHKEKNRNRIAELEAWQKEAVEILKSLVPTLEDQRCPHWHLNKIKELIEQTEEHGE